MFFYRAKRYKFVIIPTVCVTLFLFTKIIVHWLHVTCVNIPVQALVVEEERTCFKSLPKKSEFLFSTSDEIKKPSCENILTNLTAGIWIEKMHIRSGQRREMDSFLQNYRVNVLGYNSKYVRDDMQCGFEVPAESSVCNLVKTYQSAWCNPNGLSPCCTSALKGKCVSADICLPNSGINLASYVHAELSEWKPLDSRCSYVKFDQSSACQLLAAKHVRSVGFVGNSLIRNMYSVFLQMLTDNYLNGSLQTCVPPSIRKLCAGHMQIMDNNCLTYGLATSSKNLPKPGICNGQLDLKVYLEMYWLAKFGTELQLLLKAHLDIDGSYLLVGIGIHDSYNSKLVIKSYLQPAIKKLKDHSWPKLIWVHTLKSGIFKPPEYIKYHGDDQDIDQFVTDINEYCKTNNIRTLDFRNLTTGVWSIDGTHFGTAVNRIKIQFFLNLLLSL